MKTHKEYRFKENPKEKEVVDKFKKEVVSIGITKNIVFENNARNLTNEEERIILSTIQWLGSPVGLSFINEFLKTK